MEARLLELGLKWQDVATAGGISLRALVRARTGDQEILPRTLAGIDRGLRWELGTAARILAGEEPAPTRHEPSAPQRLERRGAPFPQQLLDLLDLENTPYYREVAGRAVVAAAARGIDVNDPGAHLEGEWVFPEDDADSIVARAQWDFLASDHATPLGEAMTVWQIVAALAVPVAASQPEVRARLLGEHPQGNSAAGLPRTSQ
jgi:hypothetical protein